MNANLSKPKKRFSTRRKALLGLALIVLGAVGWLHYIGAAGTSGIASKDMDWNADGTVTQQEMMQAFYAVAVTKTREGQRECSEYYWRQDKRGIRVDCRTSMAAEPAKK